MTDSGSFTVTRRRCVSLLRGEVLRERFRRSVAGPRMGSRPFEVSGRSFDFLRTCHHLALGLTPESQPVNGLIASSTPKKSAADES